MLTAVLIVHLVATAYMTGLIWFVQIVHYPLMGSVGADRFCDYASSHVQRTTAVVAPPMLLELATAVALLWLTDGRLLALAWAGMVLVVVVWMSTAAVQVPCHRVLERGFDEAAHRRLVRTNWVRTAAWSLRAMIAAAMLGLFVAASGPVD